MTCELCSKLAGQFDLGRTCCCLRLIDSAPQAHRKAMAAHVQRSVGDRWEEVLEAARAAGMTRGEKK